MNKDVWWQIIILRYSESNKCGSQVYKHTHSAWLNPFPLDYADVVKCKNFLCIMSKFVNAILLQNFAFPATQLPTDLYRLYWSLNISNSVPFFQIICCKALWNYNPFCFGTHCQDQIIPLWGQRRDMNPLITRNSQMSWSLLISL